MKKYSLLLLAIVLIAQSCTKNLNVADYNIRDINAGHLIGNWGYDSVYADDFPEGLIVSKTPGLQDDYIRFVPGQRIDNVAAGTGVISQGNSLFFADKGKDIPFTWRMDPDHLNTVIIEVWDQDHNLIGGNIANIDGSNSKLVIASAFKIVVVNGQQKRVFYSTSYYCHQLPW